jgi:hypothetical protein
VPVAPTRVDGGTTPDLLRSATLAQRWTSKSALALEWLSHARKHRRGRPASRLFDAWYPSRALLTRMRDDGWSVVCRLKKKRRFNGHTVRPHRRDLDAALASRHAVPEEAHPTRVCPLRARRRDGRALRLTRGGLRRLDAAPPQAAARRDGKVGNHRHDERLTPTALAVGYQQRPRVEASWRTLTSGLRCGRCVLGPSIAFMLTWPGGSWLWLWAHLIEHAWGGYVAPQTRGLGADALGPMVKPPWGDGAGDRALRGSRSASTMRGDQKAPRRDPPHLIASIHALPRKIMQARIGSMVPALMYRAGVKLGSYPIQPIRAPAVTPAMAFDV